MDFFLFQQLQRNDQVNARRCQGGREFGCTPVCSAEASQPHLADTLVSAESQHQTATSVAGLRGALPREDVDPELVG